MNYEEKLGASENPFTSQTSTLGDREDKLDALENHENPFTGSNFTWGEREENFGSANSFNKQPNKMIHRDPEDRLTYRFLWIQIVNLLMKNVSHLMVD